MMSFSFSKIKVREENNTYRATAKIIQANCSSLLPTNCLSVFGHFVGLALKRLRRLIFAKIIFHEINFRVDLIFRL